MTFLSAKLSWLIWFTYVLQQASGISFGPRGMYCSSPMVDGLPKLAIHFTPERFYYPERPFVVGHIKMYGLSAGGNYSTIDWRRIAYTASKAFPLGDPRRPAAPINVGFPSGLFIESFSNDIGLGSADLLRMIYSEGSSIQVNTSKGPVVLTHDACLQGLVGQQFCTTLEPGGIKFVVATPRTGISHLFIHVDNGTIYSGPLVLDDYDVPMNISLVKSNERDIDRLLDIMPYRAEYAYEQFWTRGKALSWDPLGQELKLHPGEWTLKSLGSGTYRGPPLPDVNFTLC